VCPARSRRAAAAVSVVGEKPHLVAPRLAVYEAVAITYAATKFCAAHRDCEAATHVVQLSREHLSLAVQAAETKATRLSVKDGSVEVVLVNFIFSRTTAIRGADEVLERPARSAETRAAPSTDGYIRLNPILEHPKVFPRVCAIGTPATPFS